MNRDRLLAIVCLITLALFGSAYADSAEQGFNAARRSNTTAAYVGFLERFPQSRFENQALSGIARKEAGGAALLHDQVILLFDKAAWMPFYAFLFSETEQQFAPDQSQPDVFKTSLYAGDRGSHRNPAQIVNPSKKVQRFDGPVRLPFDMDEYTHYGSPEYRISSHALVFRELFLFTPAHMLVRIYSSLTDPLVLYEECPVIVQELLQNQTPTANAQPFQDNVVEQLKYVSGTGVVIVETGSRKQVFTFGLGE